MPFPNPKLIPKNWSKLTLAAQLANIGSEVSRAMHWFKDKEKANQQKAAERVLDLIDLVIADQRWRKNLLEITRLRETLCDFFFGQNIYQTTSKNLQDYFLPFALMSRKIL